MIDPNVYNKFALLNYLCATNDNFYFKDHQIGSHTYRIFNYRIVASYSDWLLSMARECRGHTYLMDGKSVRLVSNPMQKFFNFGENPLATFYTDEQFWKDCVLYEKLDGSLISTVWNPAGKLLLKSKSSFTSDQAVAATEWLSRPENVAYFHWVQDQVFAGNTVNFEWVAPDNQIVVKYLEPCLVVINIRSNVTGEEQPLPDVINFFQDGVRVCKTYRDLTRPDIFVKGLTDLEGYVCWHPTHGRFKLKSDWYSLLHKSKDQLTYMSAYEAALNDSIDDLIALFSSDSKIQDRLREIQLKALDDHERAESRLTAFHDFYGDLDRKEYALKALNEFQQCGLFAVAMNIYQRKDMNLVKALLKIEEAKGYKL